MPAIAKHLNSTNPTTFVIWYNRCFAVKRVNRAEQRWDEVVGQFRQLCLLRRQKKFLESDIILTSELPRAIANWSESFEGDPATKKSRLDNMFQAEQRRIDDAYFTMDLLTSRIQDEIVPSICAEITEQVRATVIEDIRATILKEVRASVAEDIRSVVATELRAIAPPPVQKIEPAPAAKINHQSPKPVTPRKDNLLSNFAEQVRSTVAQKAYVAVLEELAREKKPAKALQLQQKIQPAQKPKAVAPSPAPARPSRPAIADVPAVIDFVLAEEQQFLKNKYKFELSACP
jgi:hypothetical protein